MSEEPGSEDAGPAPLGDTRPGRARLVLAAVAVASSAALLLGWSHTRSPASAVDPPSGFWTADDARRWVPCEDNAVEVTEQWALDARVEYTDCCNQMGATVRRTFWGWQVRETWSTLAGCVRG